MKIAITAVGSGMDEKVDERFGRARYFAIVDTEDGSAEFVDNETNRNAMGGAGVASAELVADAGAKAVVTGHLGPKALPALNMAGITGYSGAGMTISEALAAFKAGTLAELTEAGKAHPQ